MRSVGSRTTANIQNALGTCNVAAPQDGRELSFGERELPRSIDGRTLE